MRLVNNNYKYFHAENRIMLWACEEGQSWDKDSGDGEKGTVKGSVSEKEMRGFRKRLVCGMKKKKIMEEDTFLQFKKLPLMGYIFQRVNCYLL